MPVYIPPLVKKVEIGKIPTNLGDISDVFISSPITGDSLFYNGSLWINKPGVSKTDFNAYQSSVTATSGAIRIEMNGLHSTDAMLQQEINEIVVASKIVFCEEFTGNGTTTAVLDGSITNGNFISGGWSVLGVANTLPAYVTDLAGQPIYDSGNIFTRHRIAITTVASNGTVTFDYAPQVAQAYKVWYFYSLTVNDRLENYYRDDFVAGMEEDISSTVLASQVMVNTATFDRILGPTDTTLQAALDTLDEHTHNILRLTTTENNILKTLAPNGSGGVAWIDNEVDVNIVAGTGISIGTSGMDHIVSVIDYISKMEVSSISGSLNNRVSNIESTYATKSSPISGTYNNVVVNSQGIVVSGGNVTYSATIDLSGYTLLSTTQGVSATLNASINNEVLARSNADSLLTPLTTTASISGDLQGQINAIIQEGTTIASSGGSIIVTKTGLAFNLEVATAPIQNHNSLNGLQGGISGQYYHLSASQYNDFIGKSEVTTVSGGLNTSINNETIFRTAGDLALQTEINNITGGNFVLDTRYSKTTDVAVISGGLSNRLTNVENTYATKSSGAAGTYNNVIVNSQGIVTSGGNVTYTIPSDLGVYTLLSTTQGVSATLNTSVNNETIFRTAGDLALQSEINNITGGNFVLDTRYSKLSDVAVISGGLNTSINNEATIRYNADLALQSEINNITGGSFVLDSRYTTLSTTSSISGNLQDQIDLIVQEGTTIASSGGTILIHKNVLAFNLEVSDYISKSDVRTISGGLNTSINNETIFRAAGDLALQTEINNITGGNFVLDSRYTTLNASSSISASLVNYTLLSTTQGVSATLNTSITNETIFRTAGDLALQTEINNITGGSFVLDSRYTTLVTTASISGDLQGQINAIVQEGTTIASSGGSIVVTKNGLAFNLEVATAPIQDHNSLNGLQGGVSGQYYHLTSSQYADYIGKIEVATVSGGLNTSITNETIFRTAGDLALQTEINNITGGSFVLDSRYSKTTDVAVISGGLNDRLVTVEGNYATKATPNAGTYNNVVVNSQGIVTSGGNITYTIPNDLNPYTLLSTTQGVSATLNTSITNETIFRTAYDSALQSEINNITGGSFVLDTRYSKTSDIVTISGGLNTSINNANIFRVAGDLALQTQINNITGGSFVLDTRYSKTSDIVTISGGLNSRLTTVETNYATKSAPTSGTYNNVVVNSQGIVTSGGNISYALSSDLSSYTLLSTTASISGSLQGQIDTLILDTISITSSGGTVLVTREGVNYNLEVALRSGIQGRVVCTTATEYTINHATVDPVTDFPVVSLEVANNNSDLFIQGIYDRTATSFKVVLSGIPDSSNAILYHLTPTASIDLSPYVLKSDLNTVYSISGSSVLTNTQHNIIQTNTPIVTTLWLSPTNGDFINIANDTTSGENVISGNGQLIEGDYSFIIYYGESFTFRYNGTTWKAF